MSEKRKISTRRIIQTFVTILVTGAFIVAVFSAAKVQDSKKVKGFEITIKNDKYQFIDKEEVKSILQNDAGVDVNKAGIGSINTSRMEKVMDANPWVGDAQVYIDNRKVVHVNIEQRVPVARLFDQSGASYYLDHTMKAMPLSDRYVHYSTVVTNVPVLNEDSNGDAMRAQIVAMVKYIEHDSFWSAQISQIVCTDDKTFEVVPVLGNHKILIGDTSRLDEKFDNLYAFYKKVLNRIGWDKYEVLDVRYASQVVASPTVQWKAPVDKAMSNMNWVKAVIGSDSTANSKSMAISKPVPQTAITISKTTKASVKAVVHEPVVPVQTVIAKPTIAKPVVKPKLKQVVKQTKPNPVKTTKAVAPKKAPAKKAGVTKAVKDKKQTAPKYKNDNKEKKPKYLYQAQ
jgi:cell division protein FtsQ